ncbi:MAG: translation initiation factor IF-2 subunit beta [Candidatus Micrarchaeia archaeon]
MNYDQLLDKAFKELPTLSVEKSDFEIPQVDSLVQGSKTILKNIDQISDKARRSQEDIAKYLSKELAAPVSINNHVLEISAKINQQSLKTKIEMYFKTYVICKECKKPDTRFEQRDRGYVTIVCEACGARYTVKIY